MKKFLLKFEGSNCIAGQPIGSDYLPKENEEVIESEYLGDLYSYNKDPQYINEAKLEKIKQKTKELLLKHNYIFGLSSGWQQDNEFKSWFESLIDFQQSFEGQTITESEITFPTDPRGDTVTLKF